MLKFVKALHDGTRHHHASRVETGLRLAIDYTFVARLQGALAPCKRAPALPARGTAPLLPTGRGCEEAHPIVPGMVYGPIASISEVPMPDVHGPEPRAHAAIAPALAGRSVVLVGIMGAGKSSVGRRLAARLGLPFVDADSEIEEAAYMSIPEIFNKFGEARFRAAEVRVIARLLDSGPSVLATGGGAFMNADTRAAIKAKGVSVWLKAEYDVLLRRLKRRSDRPLLNTEDPGETLKRLMAERYPIYAEADLTIVSREVAHDRIVDEIISALCRHLHASAGGRGAPLEPRP